MPHYTQKLSFKEKAGYSLGDSGANFVFQVLMAFQMIYFTQVMGISPVAAGIIFGVGRFFDAFTDPMMGVISDRTKHRWGRFRPWLLWSAVPFGIIYWLAFTRPDFGDTGRLIYVAVMYFLLMAIYTVNNVPYCALNGVMTGDVDERTSLSSYRFVAVTITTFIVTGFTWTLVAKLGQGDDAKGWSMTIGIFAIVSVVFFIVTSLSVKERVQPDPKQQSSVKQDMKDTWGNKPWRIMFFATLMMFVMLVVRGGSQAFYFDAYADQNSIVAFLSHLNLVVPADGVFAWWQSVLDAFGLLINAGRTNVPNVAYSMMSMVGTLFMILGVLVSKALSQRFGKRAVFVTCLVLNALSTAWLGLIPADRIDIMVVQAIAWGGSWGITVPLLWSMIGDTADYSEWKTGRRATGFVYAGIVFALKFGLGVGGFVTGVILWAYGYDADSELTELAVTGIRHAAAFYPAGFTVVAATILYFYPITKELNYQIGDELAARRKARVAD